LKSLVSKRYVSQIQTFLEKGGGFSKFLNAQIHSETRAEYILSLFIFQNRALLDVTTYALHFPLRLYTQSEIVSLAQLMLNPTWVSDYSLVADTLRRRFIEGVSMGLVSKEESGLISDLLSKHFEHEWVPRVRDAIKMRV
jgi:hypothetical protein